MAVYKGLQFHTVSSLWIKHTQIQTQRDHSLRMLICGEQVDNLCAEHSVTFKIFFLIWGYYCFPRNMCTVTKKNPRIIKIISESIWLRNRKFLNLSTIDIWGAPVHCRIHSIPGLYSSSLFSSFSHDKQKVSRLWQMFWVVGRRGKITICWEPMDYRNLISN